MKMAFGNRIGFAFDRHRGQDDLFGYRYGSFLMEMAEDDGAGRRDLPRRNQSPTMR